jgi:S1-C subfamily serine protease
MVTVALLAGVVGALLASGAGVVVGEFHRSTTVERPIEQVMDPHTTYVTVATDPRPQDVTDIAARFQSTVVQLRATTNGATTSGTGVIYRSDGIILTNNHLVQGAQSVVAVTGDGHTITCHLVGDDAATDIGVVRMDSKPGTAAPIGTTTELKVGQLALVIGAPAGMSGGHSVTKGIISAVDRQVTPTNGPPLQDMIATDAAIEASTSGGALVDAGGTVVGITNAVATDPSTQLSGYATPIEVAKNVAEQLLATGHVTHAWLGVQGADVDPATAAAAGLHGGAVVQNVDARSPAGRAGVTDADIITGFGDDPVLSMGALAVALSKYRPGDRVTVDFVRDGEARFTTVVLAPRPGS